MPKLSFATRAVSATALALCLTVAGTAVPTSAQAATKRVSFSFQYRLESSTWTQKAGNTTLLITKCNIWTGEFHAELLRSRWGRDTRMEGHTLTCDKGQKATFSAPMDGTYYFVFTKLDDTNFYTGTASISYPG